MRDYILMTMKENNEKTPNPKELEKEIGEFLSRKFGESVKLVSPLALTQVESSDEKGEGVKLEKPIDFDLKPEELVSYLDQYIVKQDAAKAVLATKICTHFNRIRRHQTSSDSFNGKMIGNIKNNVLMIGPTGVGKTYMVKLIADKIGVPFVKGDATKFSETGYVGGDVEDLVRDLVREADNDLNLAQFGIIYIDEIDKIASTPNMMGADVSRTGVQRALLKPMEETDVELKVPHDPISMMQEIERYRQSGKREQSSVNTKNILFIMSGAFSGLEQIIRKRMTDQVIGFGAKVKKPDQQFNILKHVKSEDLITYGFESEFVGRLPVKAVFEELSEEDLFAILKNPNNPIVLGKKLDFAAYGINAKFDLTALQNLAKRASEENTGARGLVSAVEEALLLFEKKLPSTTIKQFPITGPVVENQKEMLEELMASHESQSYGSEFQRIEDEEKQSTKEYIHKNREYLAKKINLRLTESRIEIAAGFFCRNITNIETAVKKIRKYYDEVKKVELYFYNKHNINVVMEDNAIDFIIEEFIRFPEDFEKVYQKIISDFEYGLNLVREKTGKTRFFIARKDLEEPEKYIGELLKPKPSSLEPPEGSSDNGQSDNE
jgi:ATP-dependent Clp protease ATP-binding subunit ClpX